MQIRWFVVTGVLSVLIGLMACAEAGMPIAETALPAGSPSPATVTPTLSPEPTENEVATATRNPTGIPPEVEVAATMPAVLETPASGFTPTPYPAGWQDWPVLPTVSRTAIEIYQRGLAMGNDPHAFALVGDCNTGTPLFLRIFDYPGHYRLGEYAYLQEVIDQFAGSFASPRPAAQNGFNGATVLSPLFADPNLCEPGESPLECEFRLKNPSIVIISLGTNWTGSDSTNRRGYLSQIVEYSIQEGVVPILGTKADNLEGDHSINAMIVDVAREYDVPLWNFWRAAQELPGGGLVYTADGQLYDLSYALNNFDDRIGMQAGWPNRNLTALQALYTVWQAVSRAEPLH